MFDLLSKAFNVFSGASTAYDLVKDLKDNAEDMVGFLRNEGLYSIHNPDLNNDMVISIISNATGLSYYQVKEEMIKEQSKSSGIWIGEPRHTPSIKLIKDLKNAGAEIHWSANPPSRIKDFLKENALLYYGELDSRYELRATRQEIIDILYKK